MLFTDFLKLDSFLFALESSTLWLCLSASFCKSNTLDPALIKGKIVVCTLEIIFDQRNEKATAVKQGGGVGIILVDPLATDIGFQFEIPGTLISFEEAEKLKAYMVSQQ